MKKSIKTIEDFNENKIYNQITIIGGTTAQNTGIGDGEHVNDWV